MRKAIFLVALLLACGILAGCAKTTITQDDVKQWEAPKGGTTGAAAPDARSER